MSKEDDPETTIRNLHRDIEKAQGRRDYNEVAKCWNFIGVAYSDQGKYEEAAEAHKEELKACRQIKDQLGTAVAHRMIGESFSCMGLFRQAAEHLKEYMKIAKDLNNGLEMQRAEVSFGRLYWLHYNLDTFKNRPSVDKAEHFYKNALARATKLKANLSQRDYAQMRSRCLLNLALVFDVKGNSLSVKLLEEAITIAKKFGFTDDLLRCQLSLTGILIKKSSLQEARNFIDDAIKSAKHLKDDTQLCEALTIKANILVNLLDYDGARHLFKQAYYTKSFDDDHKVKAMSGCRKLKKVIETLKEVNSTTDLEKHLKLYDKLGDYFVDINCYTNAIVYYKRELETAIKLGRSDVELADIYFSIGQTYADNQQFKEALEAHQKELLCWGDSRPDQEVNCLMKIIEIKIKQGATFDEIQREYEFALTRCDTDKLKRQVLESYRLYLKESKVRSPIMLEIEQKLADLGSGGEEEVNDNGTSDADGSSSEVSELTDNSEPENDEEKDGKGKALRSRRSNKKIASSLKVNEKGESALHRACIEGNLSHVIKLVEGGHEVNVRDHAGWLPIHEASNHGYAEIVSYLIKKKSLINDRGGAECGDTTPLHDACANGNIDVIRVLIRNGANVIARDVNSNTPLDLLQQRIGDGDTLTKEQKKDVDLLYKEMRSLMKKAGYDFTAQNVNLVKRKHAPAINTISKPVNNFRRGFDRSPSQSPPRKSMKPNKQREAVDAKNTYKEVISHLRRPHDQVTSGPTARCKSKFKGLIEESNCVVDEWMINDLKPSALKDKPIRDAYEMTSNLEKCPERCKSSKRVKKRDMERSRIVNSSDDEGDNSDTDEEKLNANSNNDNIEEHDDYAVIESDDDNVINEHQTKHSKHQNSSEELPFDWNSHLSDRDDDDISIVQSRDKSQPTRKDYSESNQARMESSSNYLSSSPPTRYSSPSLPTSSPVLSTASSYPSPSKPSSYHSSTSSPPNQIPSNSKSFSSTDHHPPQQSVNEKFLVTVHLEGKKFLLAVPNRSTQVSWLAEKTADRYYQMRQLRPHLSLTTEEGAILGLDDLIVDVCLNNQVYACIDSWDLEPLPERYESSCKLKKAAVNYDLKFRLKLSETSGKLELTNLLLECETISHLLLSLRCQKSLRVLDFSFSDIILLDKDDNLSSIISTLPDLEEINFKGTGLVSFRLHSLSRFPLANLINIDFSYNLLDDKCSTSLIELINKSPNLKKLDLRYNDFSTKFTETCDIQQISQAKNITLLIK